MKEAIIKNYKKIVFFTIPLKIRIIQFLLDYKASLRFSPKMKINIFLIKINQLNFDSKHVLLFICLF